MWPEARGGSFRLCDTVRKMDVSSIRTHLKCDFEIVPGAAVDYLANERDDRSYGMRYTFGL